MNTRVQSQRTLFGAPLRTPPKDADTVSHRLLAQGGFIHQLASGIFSLLPLGFRVHDRITQILREEMRALGAQEILLPALHPRALWEETGRWKTMDPPLFVVKDRHEKLFALGPTHEEVVTDLARTYLHSYKQLPLSVYQIQTKFRNEQRSTGGLLRVREFHMKDLYSFHASEEDLLRFYEEVKQAYLRVFTRCGLTVVPVAADSGAIGGAVSHEFALLAETGEDAVGICSDCGFGAKKEALGEGAHTCPQCGTELIWKSCVESGHIFQLGMKYSKAMAARFASVDGTSEYFAMGCYGIGVGRLLAAIVEASHDDQGIIWPASVAPFDVHVIELKGARERESSVEKTARSVVMMLAETGKSVLYDDRDDASPGEKFADADLIGIPWRIVVSEKHAAAGTVGLKGRTESSEKTVKSADLEALLH